MLVLAVPVQPAQVIARRVCSPGPLFGSPVRFVVHLGIQCLVPQETCDGFQDGAVRQWAWSYRDVFSKHTPLIPVIAMLPVTDAPRTLAMYEAVSAGFREAGFPQERIISAIVALESFIFGSAYDATAPADIFDSGSMAHATPNFTTAVRSLEEQGHEKPADVAFTLGLEALISGFGALRR